MKDTNKLDGRGLVGWVRYLNVFGHLLLYD